MELEVYHTQEVRDVILKFPCLAEGNDHWLGDGFYFWQDIEFSKVFSIKRGYKSGLMILMLFLISSL